MKRTFVLSAALVTAALLATQAAAQQSDPVIAQGRASGLVGEQADGFLGFTPNAQISADLRSRVEQNNIRRRALYTTRAAERDVTVNEMAAAVACEIFAGRIALGERYRDETGRWRQHTANQAVVMPSFCAP